MNHTNSWPPLPSGLGLRTAPSLFVRTECHARQSHLSPGAWSKELKDFSSSMTDWLLRLRHPGQRGSFLLSRGTIGPEELWHREKIDGYYYSIPWRKGWWYVYPCSKLCILSRGRKREDHISGLNAQGIFWLGKVRRQGCRKSRASVFVFPLCSLEGVFDCNGTTQKKKG